MKKFSNKIGLVILFIILIITSLVFYYIIEAYRFYDLSKLKKAVVVKPVFTSSAYQPHAFYAYYKGECNTDCLTVKINETESYTSSKNALDVFRVVGIKIITDLDVHNNPEILSQYKTVIMLHSEYVTQEEFDAITSHPHVIYLYPNALYAKVIYQDEKITLLRGHNYPQTSIANGFDWQYDNTHPNEYDTKCNDWNFYKIENGYMLNCYPENVIKRKPTILIELAKLTN